MLKVIKENLDEIMKWANFVFLFLFSLHLYDFPDKYIILWCGFSMLVFIILHKNACLDKIFWILALAIILNGLGTYYYVGDSLGYTWKNVFKMVIPVIIMYPYMKQLMCNIKDEDTEKIVLAIVLGTFLYSILNYYSFCKMGKIFLNGERRSWCDFWSGYGWAATHYSFWGCFIAGLSGYGVFLLYERKWLKGLLLLFLVAIENYIQIAVDNRMVICITVVSLTVSLLLFLYLNINDKIKIKKTIFFILAVVAMPFFVVAINLFDIQSSSYLQNFISRDGGILKNNRFQMIYEAIIMLPSHWKGGATMWAAGNAWVHNYWLQVANVSGIIPFSLWMIVNISAMIDTIKVMRCQCISDEIKFMVIPLISAIVGYLMMEPGGTELNRYIIFYVLLIALMKQIVANKTCSKE